MKRLDVLAALLVFLLLGLAVWSARPEPEPASLFGSEVALSAELKPLALAGGALELRGRVRSAAGAPASDTFVALLRASDDPSEAEPLYHAYTDAAGRFALTGLAPGRFRVVLMHPSAPPRGFAFELPEAGPSEDVEWELAAPLEPLPALPDLQRTTLAGRIRLPEALAGDGAALPGFLAGFEVVLTPASNTPLLAGACERRATTDEAGRFAIAELVAADYSALVLPPWARGGTWPVLARGACTAHAGGAATLELALAVGELAGELGEPSGRPLVGALVAVSTLDARDPVGGPQLWPPLVTDTAGKFRVELLPPGRYRVHLRAGAAARDVEVTVAEGQRTSMPPEALDPRPDEAAPGG